MRGDRRLTGSVCGFVLCLSACSGINGGNGDPHKSGFCDAELLDVSPAANSEAVILVPDFERTRTQFDIVALTWDRPPALPSVEVVDLATGEAVNGRTHEEEGVWYWWPTDYLSTETDFEVRVEVFDGCGQETVTQFTTDVFGAPADSSCFDGGTFILAAEEDEPGAMEPMLNGWALELRGADGLLLAGLDGGRQDLCMNTLEMRAIPEHIDNPVFAAHENALVAGYAGMDMELTDITVSGMVSSDCETVGRVSLSATVDIAPAAAAVGVSIEEMCIMASTFSGDDGCIPCEDGELHCLALENTGLSGSRTHLDLVEVTQSDVLNNWACE